MRVVQSNIFGGRVASWVSLLVLGLIVGAGMIIAHVVSSPLSEAAPEVIDLQATGRVAGLYRTGVSNSGAKLPENRVDPHWEIARVYYDRNASINPCQYAANGATGYRQDIYWPGGGGSVTSAFTIAEFSGGKAGAVILTDPYTVGDLPRGEPATLGVWGVTSPNARWIGQNLYGQQTHRSTCPDPSRYGLDDMTRSIVFVYRLKGGFTIDSSVDPSTVSLQIKQSYFDNGVKISVNGNQVGVARYSATTGGQTAAPTTGWVTPGFHYGADSVATAPVTGVFHTGATPNTLEVHVGSTYSAAGMLIGDISLRGSLRGDYTLTPSVENMGAAVELGETVSPQLRIQNGGPTPSYDTTQWISKRIVLRSGESLSNTTGSAISDSDACAFYSAPGGRCTDLATGSGAVPTAGFSQDNSIATESADVRPGDQICFTMSVKPYSSAATGDRWRHSYACSRVGVKPKVQIQGGDVLVGRGFDGTTRTSSTIRTSLSQRTGGVFGSWDEYAASAPSAITTFSTNAGLDGGNPSSGQGVWSRLTFANTGTTCGSGFGCWTSDMGRIPDVESAVTVGGYTMTSGTPDAVRAQIAAGANCSTPSRVAVQYTGTAPLVVSDTALSVRPGCTVIIKSTRAAVRITQNITYQTASYSSIETLPQVLVFAPSIAIDPSAQSIDAWLIGYTSIDTCTEDGARRTALALGDCAQPLRVNGPVMTGALYLSRTGGSGTGAASGDPAEVFNLRADAYLWALSHGLGNGRATTVYQRELAPRF